MKREIKKNKGFSLVELIIVIAIMVILGAIIAPQYFKHVKNANIASDVEQAARISTAISSEYAAQATGAKAVVTLTPYDAADTASVEWVAVSKITKLTGEVKKSKVEKDSEFFYSLDADGDVRIGIGTTTPIADDHIIAPMNTEKDNKWK